MSTSPNPYPASGQPAPPAQQQPKQKIILWVAIGFTIVVFCCIFAFMLVMQALRGASVKVNPAGGVDIHGPGGFSLQTGKAADTGLPVYPDASASTEGANVSIGTNENQSAIAAGVYTTSDPIEKVDAWYTERLGKDFTREGPGTTPVIVKGYTVHVETGEIGFIADHGNYASVVSLSRTLSGGTRISLARFGDRETQ
jgi:hypothetical protein